uniref:Riboflavin kinase n=1 Tax=Kwoniella pini CBS 10737 TaxID=1296096 RepID=A0A1B9HT74_9TREE|nr:riboflavin kinase [Kwoniella pini CBS 10737]OCF46464.1 riboflavin kinase [Kwoniella pini CBS 10737]
MAAQAPAPAPPNAPMAPISRGNRPTIVGPDQPEDPYPIKLEGTVTKGFGRGARFLGIPTANLPDTSLDELNELNMTGIYYGFARIHPSNSTPLPSTYPTPIHSDEKIWPMVMSVGWNPYFKNEKITAEVHIMHPFKADFYGHHMSVIILGYIRPELDYVSKEALIEDIQTDVKVALNGLARPEYAKYAEDPFLTKDRV